MKQKAGIAIFLFGVIWSLVWGLVISISCTTAINTMTLEQLNESVWSPTGPLMMLWGVGGVPLGTVIAGIGLLLYTNAKGLTTLFFTFGVLLAIIVAMTSGSLEFYPFLFGIGGSIILLSFFGILWFWAKNRKDMEGRAAKAANLSLVAYVFFLNASWFTCGMGGQMMAKAFEGFDGSPPLHIMIFFVLGWVFLFLSHYQLRKEKIA
jgi:hypothetical protein